MTASWHGEAMRAEVRSLSNLWRFGINCGCLDVTDGCLADWLRIKRTCMLVLDVCLCFTLQNEAWLQIASISLPFPVENIQWCFSLAPTSVETVKGFSFVSISIKVVKALCLPSSPASVPVSGLWSKSNVELLLRYLKPPEPLRHPHSELTHYWI